MRIGFLSSDALKLERVRVAGGELSHVEGTVCADDCVVRMGEDFAFSLHGAQGVARVVFGGGCGDVRNDLEVSVEDGDEAAAVAILWPVVSEMRADVVVSETPNLARVTAW